MSAVRFTRRKALGLALGGAAASVLAACQSAAPAATPTPIPNPLIKPKPTGAELTPVLASSELAVGRNRFALGLIDAQNQPIVAGNVLVEYFKILTGGQAEKRSQAEAVFRSVGGQSKGIWVAPAEFNEAGPWGVQVAAAGQAGAAARVARMNIEVKQAFSAPGYDAPAPRTATPTEKDVGGDLSKLCTNQPPCGLHKVSIAEALQGGQKPLVALFATPQLCTSATCGPELEAVLQLQRTYEDRVTFVHVEIYEPPFDGAKVASAVTEWNLPSEPWLFVIDRTGIVRDRFEGATPADELEPAIKAVL